MIINSLICCVSSFIAIKIWRACNQWILNKFVNDMDVREEALDMYMRVYINKSIWITPTINMFAFSFRVKKLFQSKTRWKKASQANDKEIMMDERCW